MMVSSWNAGADNILVGDIGGTNARFGLISEGGQNVRRETFDVASYETFDEALEVFLGAAGVRPDAACIAVAGPVKNGSAKFTNSAWRIDQHILRTHLEGHNALVINDFEALSRYAFSPREQDIVPIKAGTPQEGAPVLAIGPGTGLGQGLVCQNPEGVTIIATEGGHVMLPCANDLEFAIFSHVSKALSRQAVAEDILSGAGLMRLHRAMVDITGEGTSYDKPSQLSAEALDGDAIALRTFHQFCAFLGNVTGNAVLATGARGGVMLAGGILPKVQDILATSPFVDRMLSDRVMRPYLEGVPVHLLTASDAALRGAAMILQERRSN